MCELNSCLKELSFFFRNTYQSLRRENVGYNGKKAERTIEDMSVFISILNTMLISFIELIYLVGVIIAVGLVIGVIERYTHTYLILTFGPRGVYATAWIGTPIHEIGHLIQCFIWGHRVTRVKLLQLHSPNGVLGYVQHQYNPNSLYQQIGNFFIGIGPIISGVGSLILAMYLLVPESYESFSLYIFHHVTLEKLNVEVLKTTWGVVVAIVTSLFTLTNLINPLFWLFIMVSLCVSTHIALSKEDIKGSAKGLIALFFVLVLLNLVSGILGFDSDKMILKLAEYNAYVLAFSSIAILFSLIAFVLSYTLYKFKT